MRDKLVGRERAFLAPLDRSDARAGISEAGIGEPRISEFGISGVGDHSRRSGAAPVPAKRGNVDCFAPRSAPWTDQTRGARDQIADPMSGSAPSGADNLPNLKAGRGGSARKSTPTRSVQRTLRRAVEAEGVALHSGDIVKIRLLPALAGSGIVFVRTDLPAGSDRFNRANEIRAYADYVCDSRLCTSLMNEAGAQIAMVEHLLAACIGLELDNLRVEVNGGELPILDGSSDIYCDLLLEAGFAPQHAPRQVLHIIKPVEIIDNGQRFVRLEPLIAPQNASAQHADCGFEMDLQIHFTDDAIGSQHLYYRQSPMAFLEELSFSRTFGFAHEVDAMRAIGLARGGSLDNAIVVDQGVVLNPEGLRRSDEFVRHKALDALGDLALAGLPICGRFIACEPGHALNGALVRKLLQHPDCFRVDRMG